MPLFEHGAIYDVSQKPDVMSNPTHIALIQSCRHPCRRLGSVSTRGDQFGDHRDRRTEKFRSPLPRLYQRGHRSQPWAPCNPLSRPVDGRNPPHRVLRVDARLHRPPIELNIALIKLQLFTCGDQDHLLDKVETCHAFGYRMLNLQTGIHLKKKEIPLGINDELDGPCGNVPNRFGKCDPPAHPSRGASSYREMGLAPLRSLFDGDAGSNIPRSPR